MIDRRIHLVFAHFKKLDLNISRVRFNSSSVRSVRACAGSVGVGRPAGVRAVAARLSATQRDSRDRVAGITINARPRPAREGTPPSLQASFSQRSPAGRIGTGFGISRPGAFPAREKWGSDRPVSGRGAVRLSTGRQRRTVGNRTPISMPELLRRHAGMRGACWQAPGAVPAAAPGSRRAKNGEATGPQEAGARCGCPRAASGGRWATASPFPRQSCRAGTPRIVPTLRRKAATCRCSRQLALARAGGYLAHMNQLDQVNQMVHLIQNRPLQG